MKMSAAKYAYKFFVSKKHLFVYFFIALTCISMLFASWHYLFITNKYTITIDASCSATMQQHIKEYTHELILKKKCNNHSLICLKSQFNFLRTINARYISPGYIHISLKTLAPIIRINEQHVMLENGVITDAATFNEDIIKELPSILVQEKDHIHTKKFAFHLQQWLEHCSPELFAQYTVRWIDHTYIQLHDKQYADFCIITQMNKIPSPRCFAQCNVIKNELFAQPMFRNRKEQKRWGVDIRFKNQFVVHTMHEGVA